jgi:two-component system NarL family response regulator
MTCVSVEPEVIRVFILAENRLLREALTVLLGKKGNIRVVDARAFSPQMVSQLSEASPDILLSDSSVLGAPDFRLVAEVRAALPGLKVVAIGMEEDRDTLLQAVREGVLGVRAVAEGRAVCPPSLCMALFEFVAEERPVGLRLGHDLGLTRREQQLIEMIDRGLTNKEIAGQLNLSEQTVKNHVHRMLRKLGASDRLAAADLCRPPRAMA